MVRDSAMLFQEHFHRFNTSVDLFLRGLHSASLYHRPISSEQNLECSYDNEHVIVFITFQLGSPKVILTGN